MRPREAGAKESVPRVNYPPLNADALSWGLAVPSFVFTPGSNFRERTASGRWTSQVRRLDGGPSTSGLYPEAIASSTGDADRQATSGILRRQSFLSATPFHRFSKSRNGSLPVGVPLLENIIPDESTGWALKGQALQLADGLDFLSIETLRVVDGVSIEVLDEAKNCRTGKLRHHIPSPNLARRGSGVSISRNLIVEKADRLS